MKSIFRETKNIKPSEQIKFKSEYIRKRYSDNGIDRARLYGLESKLYFSEFSGFKIKEIIEIDFNYFTWFARKIENFFYDEETLKYAEECLKILEYIGPFATGGEKKNTGIGKIINQVNYMLEYEFYLDNEGSELELKEAKEKIDIKFYKTIENTRYEKLVRQARDCKISPEYRRKYFNEILDR